MREVGPRLPLTLSREGARLRAVATVDRYLTGCRIDSVLVKLLRSYTAWRMLRMISAGCATVDGVVAHPQQRVFTGQRLELVLAEPPDLVTPPEDRPLEICFEDEHLLVVNKPAGLIVHPTGEIPDGTLLNAVQAYLDRQSLFPAMLKPGVVHRLDMDTSGTIALCKEHLSHRELSIQFQRERVSKTYLALVEGSPPNDEFVMDLPIGRAAGSQSALMSCRGDAVDRQPSKTAFKVCRRWANHALLEARPRTGRMHQIRIHLATAGFPIIGDAFYGMNGAVRPQRIAGDALVSPLIDRHALHAWKLAFAHPIALDWREFSAELPSDMARVIRILDEATS